MLKFISIAIVWLALIAPAPAQTQALPTTDILLVLAVDTSGSVNQTRFELQRRGYADAFRSQQVLNAIRGGSTGSIAVARSASAAICFAASRSSNFSISPLGLTVSRYSGPAIAPISGIPAW